METLDDMNGMLLKERVLGLGLNNFTRCLEPVRHVSPHVVEIGRVEVLPNQNLFTNPAVASSSYSVGFGRVLCLVAGLLMQAAVLNLLLSALEPLVVFLTELEVMTQRAAGRIRALHAGLCVELGLWDGEGLARPRIGVERRAETDAGGTRAARPVKEHGPHEGREGERLPPSSSHRVCRGGEGETLLLRTHRSGRPSHFFLFSLSQTVSQWVHQVSFLEHHTYVSKIST